MNTILKLIFPEIPERLKDDYAIYKFRKNNLMILILALFLVFEQAVYGFFISEHASRLQKVYLLSALVMFIFFLIGIYFHIRRPVKVNILHEIYELSFGAFGMGVALARFLFIEANVNAFRIPTVYIAVIYAVAVIYIFHYWQSFLLYLALSLSVIFLMPYFHPEIQTDRYVADICSNGIIAYMIAVIHYRGFLKEFTGKTEIEEKNRDLVAKNRQIEIFNTELEELSVRDSLTGLFNRRKLDEVLKESFSRAQRYKQEFSVIIMDVDHFKVINDTFGHDAGDIVLKKMADVVKSSIRVPDTCGRWGGEEFLIICPEIDLPHACRFAERLRKIIFTGSFHVTHRVTVSTGVASCAGHNDLNSLLKTADARLYEAKTKGRNRIEPELSSVENNPDFS